MNKDLYKVEILLLTQFLYQMQSIFFLYSKIKAKIMGQPKLCFNCTYFYPGSKQCYCVPDNEGCPPQKLNKYYSDNTSQSNKKTSIDQKEEKFIPKPTTKEKETKEQDKKDKSQDKKDKSQDKKTEDVKTSKESGPPKPISEGEEQRYYLEELFMQEGSHYSSIQEKDFFSGFHQDLMNVKMITCCHCKLKLTQSFFKAHATKCLTAKKAKKMEKTATKPKKVDKPTVAKVAKPKVAPAPIPDKNCYYCGVMIKGAEFNKHLTECDQKAKVFDKDLMSLETRLTKKQEEIIMHMEEKAEKEHKKEINNWIQKVEKLGYTKDDAFAFLEYFATKVPLVVHIHINKHMEFFVKDTNYRNQFETNKSSGSTCKQSRTGWENRMFDNKYMGLSHFERVKYGTINLDKNPKGVTLCSGYGQSYFLLKEDIRRRCTFTDKDSSNCDSKIGTLKSCSHVLMKFTDNQIRAGFRAIKDQPHDGKSSLNNYKQLQIHGEINFGKDIEKLYINSVEVKTRPELMKMSVEFAERFQIPYEMF